MKRFSVLLFVSVFITLFEAACSSVHVHFAKDINFDQYHSYAYVGRKLKSSLPMTDARQIVRNVDRFLRERGLEPNEQNPDLLVELNMKFHKRVDVYHANSPWPRQYQSREGNITITLKDAKTHRSIWWADMYIRYHNPKELARILQIRFEKLAKRYPPK